jgi:glutamate-1-semialdehyde 2,1-aminomutase
MSRYQSSLDLWERAKGSLAGGVSSNVRAAAQPPLYFESARGTRMVDVDGNTYLDYTLAQGPMFLGHSPPEVLDVVDQAMRQGQLYAGQHKMEIQLAEKLQALIPCADLVRFANSGSEAVHVVLRLARAYTGRKKVLKFEGHYHGWFDDELISVHPPLDRAGPSEQPQAVPASAGQANGALDATIVLPWNNLDLLRETMRTYSDELAAVIMEPVMCNTGCIVPAPGYLESVRDLCSEYGIVLIFDEVITGFRLGLGGAQEHFGVTPDLATFGKAMANGFPISCLAGKREMMEQIASLTVNHSGTYNSNVMAVAAAWGTVSELERIAEQAYPRLYTLAEQFKDGLRDMAEELGIPILVQGIGPVFHMAFTDQTSMTDYRAFLNSDQERYRQFVAKMLDKGIRILSRGLWYLSTAHNEDDVEFTLDKIRQIWGDMRVT